MKLFVTILALLILTQSCHRKLLPPRIITQVKDSVVYNEVYHDTTIYIPGEKVIVTEKVPCPKWDYDTVAVRDNVKLHVNITNGHLIATCEADSLKKVIKLLSSQIKNYHETVKTVEVPVKVPQRFIPKWVWWLLGINAMLLIYVFRNPIISLIIPGRGR